MKKNKMQSGKKLMVCFAIFTFSSTLLLVKHLQQQRPQLEQQSLTFSPYTNEVAHHAGQA